VDIDPKLLAAQPLFSCLDTDQLAMLAGGARRIRFGRGERIIRQGDAGDSMFILSHGTAEVLAEKEGRSWPVATLSAGDCFGEISLLTGEPRSATVVAKFDCEVVEIEKQTIGILLREHPELADSLRETVVARRSATALQLANTPENGENLQLVASKEGFLKRLRQFFQL
jgi:CRP-like cAMP-binding protein